MKMYYTHEALIQSREIEEQTDRQKDTHVRL